MDASTLFPLNQVKKHTLKIFLIALLVTAFAVKSLFAASKTKLNFNDVEVLSVIKIMSKATGRTFVFQDKVLKGKRITLLSNQEFTPNEAYKIFESILNINNLSTIEEGKVTRIVTSKEAKISSVPVYNEKDKVRAGSYITRIIPVKHTKIRTIRSNLAPLVSKDAILIANEDANVLILKDTKENTERFAEIVNIIDLSDNQIASLNLEILPLNHASATEIAGLLSKIFASAAKKGELDSSKIRILSDKRTNNLILIGHPISLEKIKMLVSQLDQKILTEEGNIRVYPLKNANAQKVSEVLQKISSTLKQSTNQKSTSTKTTIIPDIPSNSLVIFADKEEFPAIENVIKKLDIERAQVFIQAIIMEVTLDKSLDLGVEWQGSDIQKSGNTDVLTTIGGVGSTGRPKTLETVSTGTDSSGAVLGVIGGSISFGGVQYSSFSAFIKAAEKETEIDILANPQILTLNNEEAEIKVGEIIPTIGSTKTDTAGNTTTTVDYKDVGVSLKITPQINMNNSVELQIDETSSNVITGTSDALSNQGAITTLNRSLKTKVVVEDGQTIVLGGMISEEISQDESKTPCLGDIPIIGWLFKTSYARTRKTNLLVFLKPKVVRNKAELAAVSENSKNKMKSAQKGRFRIDVSKEFNVPINEKYFKDEEDNDDEKDEGKKKSE